MNEAIEELKENEFKDLYADEEKPEKEYVKDINIDTDFELLFPDEYINSITERLKLYNELSLIKDEAALLIYEQKLIDRFGALPKQATGRVSGLLGLALIAFNVASPPLFGLIHDISGNYDAVFITYIAMTVGTMLLLPYMRVDPPQLARTGAD